MSQSAGGTMVPISGRIEDELYQWFISLKYESAKTNSEKLREALKELKLQHDGAHDFVTALTWFQNMVKPLSQSLSVVERDEMAHSEVMALLIENISAMAATLISSRPTTLAEAKQIEEQLVRRAMALTEALLRQGVTPSAAAFDDGVVRRHSSRTIDIALLINQAAKGEQNG